MIGAAAVAVGDVNHGGVAFWLLNGINAIGYAMPTISPGPEPGPR